LMLPLFFTFSGLNTNLLILSKMSYLLIALMVVLIGFSGKYFSCLFAMKLTGFNWRESSAVGGLVNARGLMELIITNIGFTYGVINKQFYAILILLAIVTTLTALPIFKMSLRIKAV